MQEKLEKISYSLMERFTFKSQLPSSTSSVELVVRVSFSAFTGAPKQKIARNNM